MNRRGFVALVGVIAAPLACCHALSSKGVSGKNA